MSFCWKDSLLPKNKLKNASVCWKLSKYMTLTWSVLVRQTRSKCQHQFTIIQKRIFYSPLCCMCCTWIGPRSRINKQTDLLIKKSLFNLGTSEWESVRCWSHCKHRERGVSVRQRVTDRRWIKVNAYLPGRWNRWQESGGARGEGGRTTVEKYTGYSHGPWQHEPVYVYRCLIINPKDTI